MCLSKVKPIPVPKNGVGWKVFDQRKDGTLMSLGGSGERKIGVQYKSDLGGEFGFHIFPHREDAVRLVLEIPRLQQYIPVMRKVKFEGVSCTGVGDGFGHPRCPVIVAQVMTILPEEVD